MTDTLDLTGEIADAVTAAAERGHTLALGYVDDEGYPAVSFRVSVQSLGSGESGEGVAARLGGQELVEVFE